MPDYEAFIIGDCCPYFEQYRHTSEFLDKLRIAKDAGSRILAANFPVNFGHCGYAITNYAIRHARGKYFMFYANDDVISPDHLDNYLSHIEGTDLDFMYFDGSVRGERKEYQLKYGYIGHDSLIIRTEFLKQMPPHGKKYGHDFQLIKHMMQATKRYSKAPPGTPATYHIMTNYSNRIDPEGLD